MQSASQKLTSRESSGHSLSRKRRIVGQGMIANPNSALNITMPTGQVPFGKNLKFKDGKKQIQQSMT